MSEELKKILESLFLKVKRDYRRERIIETPPPWSTTSWGFAAWPPFFSESEVLVVRDHLTAELRPLGIFCEKHPLEPLGVEQQRGAVVYGFRAYIAAKYLPCAYVLAFTDAWRCLQ